MRKSPLLHPLAVLRTTLGLTQKEMGDLVGRAARTVQSIELGKLPLCEELALRIAEATGVDEAWLLDGNPDIPPRKGLGLFRAGKGRGVYTKADYEFHRAFLESDVATKEELEQIRKEAEEKGGEHVTVPVSVFKSMVVKKQIEVVNAMDRDLGLKLAVLLDETKLTEVMFLARWKIGKFLDELAKDLRVKLPAPGTPAKDVRLSKLEPARKNVKL